MHFQSRATPTLTDSTTRACIATFSRPFFERVANYLLENGLEPDALRIALSTGYTLKVADLPVPGRKFFAVRIQPVNAHNEHATHH